MNMELDKLKNITIFVIILSCIIVITIYIAYFHNSQISTDSTDWGNFGDYISGIIIPIISICNLVILIYIAKIANVFDTNLHKQTEINQKEIAKNQIIFEIVKLFIKDFDQLLVSILEKNNKIYKMMCFKIDEHTTILKELEIIDSNYPELKTFTSVCNDIDSSYNIQNKTFTVTKEQLNELSKFRTYLITNIFNVIKS